MSSISDTKLKFGQNDEPTMDEPDDSPVPPEARENQVLAFLNRVSIPLPPKVIFRAMKSTEGITFSDSTMTNICMRLDDEGFLMRCDMDELERGNIVEADPDDRGYYYITQAGRERIGEDS